MFLGIAEGSFLASETRDPPGPALMMLAAKIMERNGAADSGNRRRLRRETVHSIATSGRLVLAQQVVLEDHKGGFTGTAMRTG